MGIMVNCYQKVTAGLALCSIVCNSYPTHLRLFYCLAQFQLSIAYTDIKTFCCNQFEKSHQLDQFNCSDKIQFGNLV